MDIKTLDTLAEDIALVRSQRVVIEGKVKAARAALEERMKDHLQSLKDLDNQEEMFREMMAKALRETKKDSWQTEKVSVSLQSSDTFKVVDPTLAIAWIEEHDLAKEYIEPSIKSEFKGVMEQVYAKKETIPGTQKTTKEFVRVVDRKPKTEKEA